MKRFTSILFAFLIVLSAIAAPVRMQKTVAPKATKGVKAFKHHKVTKNAKDILYRDAVKMQGLQAKKALAPRKAAKEEVSFQWTISDLDQSSFSATVTPSDNEVMYYWDLDLKSTLDGMSDAQIAAYWKNYLEEQAASYEVTLPELLQYWGSTGEDSYEYTGLAPETAYLLVAVAFDEEGNTGAVSKYEVTTLAVPEPENKVDLGTLICTDVDMSYFDYYGDYVLTLDDDADEPTVELMLDIYDDDFAGTFTMADLDDYSSIWFTGNDWVSLYAASITATLSQDGLTSTYTGWVQTEDTRYTFTAVVTVPQPVDVTGGTFEIAIEDITAGGAAITVTPSVIGGAYYWEAYPTASLEGLTDAQIAAKIVATMEAAAEAQNEYYGFALYTWTDFLLYDVDSWTYETLDPETEYTVVSAYLDEDGNLLESVVKAEFKTLELVLIDLTFDFAADDEGITITPSDLEATYEYIIVSKAYYEDEEGFNSDADALAEAWYAYVGMDYAVSGVASTTYAYEQLQPNTEYVCACFGVNSGINSAVALFTFTTPEDSETGFEGTQSTEIRGQKMIINGQLFIIRDGKTFNAQGTEVK